MSRYQKPNFSNKYDMNSLTQKYFTDNIFDSRTQKELEVRFSTGNPKDLLEWTMIIHYKNYYLLVLLVIILMANI